MILLHQFDQLPGFYLESYIWVINRMNQIIEILAGLENLIYREVFFTLTLLLLSYMMIVFFISWMREPSAKRTMALLISVIILMTNLLVEKGRTGTSAAFIVFHRYKQSMLLKRRGNGTKIYRSSGDMNSKKDRLLRGYQLEHMALKFEEAGKMKHFFRIRDNCVMVLDHEAIKTDFGFKPDVLILMNSPKINLERLLKEIHPKVIVADGSNYFSYKLLWSRTAEKHKIVFHDTTKRGAFSM